MQRLQCKPRHAAGAGLLRACRAERRQGKGQEVHGLDQHVRGMGRQARDALEDGVLLKAAGGAVGEIGGEGNGAGEVDGCAGGAEVPGS